MSAAYWILDEAKRTLKPNQFSSMDMNPIRDILADQIDFEQVRNCDHLQLIAPTTIVLTGRIRVSDQMQLSPDTVIASAALPVVRQAAEINGKPYDGGCFMGNLTIFPLIYQTDCSDILIVQIKPFEREHVSTSPQEAVNRMYAISFNFTLLRELRASSFVTNVVDQGELEFDEFRGVPSIHLDGTFLLTRHAEQQLYAQVDGCFFYIASVHSKLAAPYKAPLVSAEHGVRANTIGLGFVRTWFVDKQSHEHVAEPDISEDAVVGDVILKDTVDCAFADSRDVLRVAVDPAAFESKALTRQSVRVGHGWHMT